MRIEEVLSGLRYRWVRGGAVTGGGQVEITGVTHDSRRTGPGVIFVAIQGTKADGVRFAPDALNRGAELIVMSAGRSAAPELAGASRLIQVEDDRAALAVMARNLHGRADERLPVVGVTGTNGKTTTCWIAASILEAAGVKTGLLGTVTYSLGDEEIAAERTTPEAPDIHRYLSRMLAAGCGACVMEVSSHSLDLKRVHGIGFAVAVFTNLTRDHLDYHRDMESYFRAKASMFADPPPAAAVVNLDDAYGRRLASQIVASSDDETPALTTYGVAADCAIRIAELEADSAGCRVTLETAQGRVRLESPLVGRPSAYNLTAAAAAARAMEIGWDAIAKGVQEASHVPGRMEKVGDQDFNVLVDYAHTDDALRSLLETVRLITPGRVILVFGCGGDRDRTKRPLMGAHAARLADLIFVTSDNPRGEPPMAIIGEILAGMAEVEGYASRCHVEPDRRKAIRAAIRTARPGDTVIIAGKGHETYQILGDRIRPFDDRVVARAALDVLSDKESGDGAS